MGVPGFFLWLIQNYKQEKFVFKKSSLKKEDDLYKQVNNIDYFLIDTNCMLHPECFKVLAENEKINDIDKLQRKMYKACIEYLEKIIEIADPKKGVYIAIDGVAPIAKIKQQRSRRFKSVYDRQLYSNIRKKHGKEEPFFWNNSAITPGTKFMRELDQLIRDWAVKFAKKRKLEILYSSCNTPSEGEHKLLQYIYKNKEKNYSYLMYGLDADLIFLTLATGLNNIYLLREANQMNKKDKGFNYVSIEIMKNAIFGSCESILKEKEFDIEINKDNVINDFIFICYLMGNDFLPHLPSLDIYEGAIDLLLDTYIEVFTEHNEYLINRDNKPSINNKMFNDLIMELSLSETQILAENYGKKKKIFRCRSDDPYEKELHKIENLQFNIKDTIQLGNGSYEEYRERYYKHHFNVDKEDIEDFAKQMVYHYMRGLKWITLYYFDTCPSWEWYYPYDYPPFLTDIYKYQVSFDDINFEIGNHLCPFEQLMCVLPKQSAYLLPKSLQKIMLNINSSVSHLYPTTFEIDLVNKKKFWMGHPKLPPLEIENIKVMFNKYKHKLSYIENDMNSVKNIHKVKF